MKYKMFSKFFGKKEIDYKEMVKNGAIILDVRSEEEFEGGHIEGAVNIPIEVLPLLCKKISDKNATIITCCASGVRSGVAKNALIALGYTNVYNGWGWKTLQVKL